MKFVVLAAFMVFAGCAVPVEESESSPVEESESPSVSMPIPHHADGANQCYVTESETVVLGDGSKLSIQYVEVCVPESVDRGDPPPDLFETKNSEVFENSK